MDQLTTYEKYYLTRLLETFVEESWRIEGIPLSPKERARLVTLHEWILSRKKLTVATLRSFARKIETRARLREFPGMDVRVGQHVAPFGGPEIKIALSALLRDISSGKLSPFEGHLRYEALHPFMDGNGRSGRAAWLWASQRFLNPAALAVTLQRGFLHSFYYQTLGHHERNKTV